MKLFSKIALDKRLHFYAGLIFSLLSIVICIYFTQNLILLFLIGLGIAILAGAGKELVWDKMLGWGHPDIYDFLYTLVGGILGAGVITLFLFIV